MAQTGIPDLMTQWKQMSEEFLKSWGKAYEDSAKSPAGQAATQEFEKNYVAARANMAKAAREAYGPLIEAVGAVPLVEFQRLADQVHLILQRLDKIDDALTALAAAQDPSAKVPKKRKARK